MTISKIILLISNTGESTAKIKMVAKRTSFQLMIGNVLRWPFLKMKALFQI